MGDDELPDSRHGEAEVVDRDSLCFSQPHPGLVLHSGNERYREELARLYPVHEGNAAERLVKLKSKLRSASSEDFWATVTEGLAELTDAQWAFISKRILLDDGDVPVEMPPIGEPGACLMAAAFYFNDERGLKDTYRNFKYHAYACPCAYMKHDKIFLIPERLNEFIVDNPNKLVIPGEAYLGIPLFAEGKCFAHFGVMWSAEGAARRKLSWSFMEMMLHSLEDLILERVLEGRSFAKPTVPHRKQSRVVPHEAVTTTQSLKPYARSLSHELRTPMQGVVGMLDVMYAAVQEAAEGQTDARVRQVFETLKENIEVVQDSSRRAVEAADNVVHAYDMNMGVPDTPLSPLDEEAGEEDSVPPGNKDHSSDVAPTGTNSPATFRGRKRRSDSTTWSSGAVSKLPATLSTRTSKNMEHEPVRAYDGGAHNTALATSRSPSHAQHDRADAGPASPISQTSLTNSPPQTAVHILPGLRHTDLRHVLQFIINDSLKIGGRPESAIARETESGENIEVRVRNSNGTEDIKFIDWSVDPGVPETILVEEKDLIKMISCVFLNAVKFTTTGIITVHAKLSPKSRYVVINIRDSGPGIPAAFLPNLFKPFSREDDSLTRQSEGLGLGLLVAKGLARKIGGDLYCVRADTSGPLRGSEFEMRVPITPGDALSRPSSPFGSPSPNLKPRPSAELDMVPSDRNAQLPAQRGPPKMSDALKDALKDHRRIPHSATSHPPSATIDGRMSPRPGATARRNSINSAKRKLEFDRNLAKKHPLTFLVAEDNKINRKLLVNMLQKFGYTAIYEAHDGADAVRQMMVDRADGQEIDVILMDLWMPFMDGYEAAERILAMEPQNRRSGRSPSILAVTADVTDGALERAAQVGMKGFLTKPYKLLDLERLIVEHCAARNAEAAQIE